jgi:hypothetical protein
MDGATLNELLLIALTAFKPSAFRENEEWKKQSCQIFLGTKYQNEKNIPK